MAANDTKGAVKTYNSFTRGLKWGTIVTALIVLIVIFLIA